MESSTEEGQQFDMRFINSGTIALITYAFGLQELSYTGSGAYSGQTDYYAIRSPPDRL